MSGAKNFQTMRVLTAALFLGCGSDNPIAPPQASAPLRDRILFDSDQDDPNGDIYSVPLTGGGPTRIAASPFVDVCPAISPDGSEIAFFSSRAGGQLALHIMAADGTDVRFVEGPVFRGQCPVWSPDGREIAFFRYESAGTATITSLRIASRNGVSVRTVTATDFNYYVAWSPDSKSLAFLRYGPPSDAAKFGVFTIQSDGSGLTRVTDNYPNTNSNVSWSSDGAVIATRCVDFASGYSRICQWSPSGSLVRTLSRPNGSYSLWGWSPAEKLLLYYDFPGKPLNVMAADGTAQVSLWTGTLANGALSSAVWSPDGGMVAVTEYFTGTTEILVVNKDGTGGRQLTNNSYSENNLSWAPRR